MSCLFPLDVFGAEVALLEGDVSCEEMGFNALCIKDYAFVFM